MENDPVTIALSEIFKEGAIKTIGDLARERELPGLENLPPAVRDHSLAPETKRSIPDNYSVLMQQAGFNERAATGLADAAHTFRIQQVTEAYKKSPPSFLKL